jgi:hypothetical protein
VCRQKQALRVIFYNRLKLDFRWAKVTSDAGLSAYWELGDAFGLTNLGENLLNDWRTAKNTQPSLAALIRQSIFSRLAGYECANDAGRFSVDPTMRHVVSAVARRPAGSWPRSLVAQQANVEYLSPAAATNFKPLKPSRSNSSSGFCSRSGRVLTRANASVLGI